MKKADLYSDKMAGLKRIIEVRKSIEVLLGIC
jgi:hypothetical protein